MRSEALVKGALAIKLIDKIPNDATLTRQVDLQLLALQLHHLYVCMYACMCTYIS
jgi:hypothetical protein